MKRQDWKDGGEESNNNREDDRNEEEEDEQHRGVLSANEAQELYRKLHRNGQIRQRSKREDERERQRIAEMVRRGCVYGFKWFDDVYNGRVMSKAQADEL